MRSAQVRPDGTSIRWVELPGAEPTRVYLHGLGAMSTPYYLQAVTHPALAGQRSLLMDLLGFGLSDRPADAAYTAEEHADAVAEAMRQAGTGRADVIAHSMGGAVATVLATRHPELVRRLVLVDATLDPVEPVRPPRPGTSGIISYSSEADFLEFGHAETLERVGPHWASTMRLAGKEALYRTAVNIARGPVPTVRKQLAALEIPRTFLYPAANGSAPDEDQLVAGGVAVVAIPECGHNIMLDNVDAFAHAVAAALTTP